MSSEQARLRRALLIERLRVVEKQKAAIAAFETEATRRKLADLADRTRSLAAIYANRDGARDGAALRSASLLSHHLRALHGAAADQATRAQGDADSQLVALASAERRRERAEAARRQLHGALLRRGMENEPIPARRVGTVLE